MANKQRGESKIILNGEEKKLRYDLNALVELEDKMGVPISELGNIKMSIKNIRSLIWCGLLHEDETITEVEIGKHITMENLTEVQESVMAAFGQLKN